MVKAYIDSLRNDKAKRTRFALMVEECYERVLICDIPEGEEHTHTDECYELRLICDKEEHTHTALCYPDTSADVESPEDWEATFPPRKS